ncbi:Helix-turn-helix [Desulfonispora thiosulfatigenes DSM 11270]|uniref:Helix-turn-helix n=1 Tax=Desulfonispora thiosulfatigenes DSM 11270 TaxID=656914 RepID=A0A1W1VRH7_DESTI|nr:helix-turn-helix transcriptional regulator [Desulfonispora thiosulfatigenes]SMB95524.1 Helix-turn-helix [Desulfonispora thiosulfatigenes DSM 11270]
MHIGAEIRRSRDNEGFTRKELGKKVGIGDRSIEAYETKVQVPQADIVLEISRICQNPWLTQQYCRWHCSIGKAYSYEILDKVNLDPASVLLKLTGEMAEAQAVLKDMLELAVNKNCQSDFTDQELKEFKKCLHQFLDVEHNIETLKISLGKWIDISGLIQEHNEKCQRNGYTQKRPCAGNTGSLKKTN